MQLQKKIEYISMIVAIASTVVTVVLSVLYVCSIGGLVIGIINNVMICLLTGSIIAYIQSKISYESEKYNAILKFYCESVALEDAIINFPYMRSGFVPSEDGLRDIREILKHYRYNFNQSARQICFGKRPNSVLVAVQFLIKSYADQMRPFISFEEALRNSIWFMKEPEETLLERGVDISAETAKINFGLEQCVVAIKDKFNEKESQAKRTAAYNTIERYLFPEEYRFRVKKEKQI